jgi:cytoskeletal protein CcmA (bactofilin family)
MAQPPFPPFPVSPNPAPGPMLSTPPRPAAPMPRRDSAERRTLIIGRGISVQGIVQDAERLVVEGTVEATMIHATELSISPGGMFKGEIGVEDAEVAGTIDGTLTARGTLIVRATGCVLGTAHYGRLQVEDGGQITGRIEMITEPARDTPIPRPAAEPA